MLIELGVRDLGVVRELHLLLGAGLTAFTGETGAGKTLIVEAIALLCGGRADPSRVRAGADEAVVEGRFAIDGEELVLKRIVPAAGRSRAYRNGSMATATELAEITEALVEYHGQHDHQTLLAPATQRDALDRFAGIDRSGLDALHARLRTARTDLDELGGDEATRAREAELVRFQLDELDAAGLCDPDEDDALAAEQERLADVEGDREAAAQVLSALTEEGGATDQVAAAAHALGGRGRFADIARRLDGLEVELADVARELRPLAESIEHDPERLDAIRQRRQQLATLCRKYGDGTLSGLFAAHRDLAARADALEHHGEHAARLAAQIAQLEAERAAEANRIHMARRGAADALASRVQAELRGLAMDQARIEVVVPEHDHVQFLLAANPGSPPQPLTKVASGGELARAMLALRLVLTSAPPVMVFDEVDAGIGGTAASALGAALARLGRRHQVLVVTHLPQVAAAADAQVGVTKVQARSATTTTAERLDEEARVLELSRMLSGQPDSEVARAHARDLLVEARTAAGATDATTSGSDRD